MKPTRKSWSEQIHSTSFQGFQDLMRRRIRDVLLVSSLYDSYIFEEDGRLYELIRNEYSDLNLSHSPELARVSNGAEAISLAIEEKHFDLIITTMHIEDMHPLQFAKQARESGLTIPIVLLAFDNRELADMVAHHDMSIFDGIFIWQGDFRLVIAIIKQLEDRMNVEHDTGVVGVQSIILIEDNIRFYSSFLPLIYTEILKQSQRLISEGVSPSHRFLRMRARPKILLCTNYEQAWEHFQKYRENILGVISDIDFLRNGKPDPEAGLKFAHDVRTVHSDIPILLQSNLTENEARARQTGALFVLKESPLLLHQVQNFMSRYFGFGDFVFQSKDGTEICKATDLKSLEAQLRTVPDESLRYHGERNHFSRWLKARTEFWLAYQLRPRKVSDYRSMDALRTDLISSLSAYRRMQQRGHITDFTKETFDPASSFARVGGGSLGGKARGLGFLSRLIDEYDIRTKFDGVQISIPAGIVIGTDVFDEFLDRNNLRDLAMSGTDDRVIAARFAGAKKFPMKVVGQLRDFLGLVRLPLAVRSSSLLEDSQYQPFAGVYDTFMIPNHHTDKGVRLRELIATIKRVYASTFYQRAKDYIKMTSYRLEEEKMAVIVQTIAGRRYASRYYPNFAGVAKSHNFYPSPPQKSSDGIVSMALGLGKMVVEGGTCVKFCPKYPQHVQQLSSIEDTLANNQHEFFALDMELTSGERGNLPEEYTQKYPVHVAEGDGTLALVGSTYSPENEAVYEGISRTGTRLVTFAPVLKNNLFHLPEVFDLLLGMSSSGMGSAVEIEFAVNTPQLPHELVELGLLQMRPLVLSREFEELAPEKIDPKRILCESSQVLGNGRFDNIHDIIFVDIHRFERSKSIEVALEVGQFNAQLLASNRPYLLIGIGRWGTLDPWLGIPVRWDQISGAKAIVETGFKDIVVTPSEGSHFFQNLTAFMVGYFTINPSLGQGSIDWDWLLQATPIEKKRYTRHLKFRKPIVVKMNGHENKGVILKPE